MNRYRSYQFDTIGFSDRDIVSRLHCVYMNEQRSQYSRPVGEDGDNVMRSMNEHHRDLTEWGLSKLCDELPLSILDVGCGGGGGLRVAHQLWPGASLTGLDISQDALAFCRREHKDLVEKGLELVEGSATDLPFDDMSFDLVMSFESFFFWDDIGSGIGEMARVTRQGGSVLICSEAYPHPDFKERNEENARLHGFTLHSPEDLIAMAPHGFIPRTYLIEERNWMTVILRKL